MIYFVMILCAGSLALAVLCTMKQKQIQTEIRLLRSRYAGMQEATKKLCDDIAQLHKAQQKSAQFLTGCVEDLRNGIVPDYEKARAAAAAVNDFHTGLAGIMGFDPMQAIKKERDMRGRDAE